MNEEEKREEIIQAIADMLRVSPFTFEFKVKKKPQGIKIVRECKQEELNEMLKTAAEKQKS